MCDLKENCNVDWISALPEPILQLIMSFLPFEQLFQISVLSRVWLQAWLTFPVLEIDEIKFRGPNCSERILQSRRYWEKVLQIRERDKVSIRKLTVKTNGSDAALSFAHRCICYAIENNVQELELKHKQLLDIWYILPPMVLSSKSINVLKLHSFKLESLGNDDVKLSSLRKLHLSDVYADDRVMKNLFAQCPLLHHLEIARDNNLVNISSCFKNLKQLHLCDVSYTDEWLNSQVSSLLLLEQLHISACDNAESIKISSPRLTKLIIYSCEKLVEVKFDTPNLRIFKYIGYAVSLSSGPLALSETDLCFYSRHNIYDSQWCVKYIDLLARFHKFSKVLNLRTRNYQVCLFCQTTT